jgi:alpha-tubulin suppressor-like RCC1 family protein
LFVCGENIFGQLGLGHQKEQKSYTSINMHNILFATTGGNFTTVITTDHCLFACGQVE